MSKKCSFNPAWLKEFSWVQAVAENKYSAFCVLCNKTLYLSNMGRTALTSHAGTKKHTKKAVAVSTSSKLSVSNEAGVMPTDIIVIDISETQSKITTPDSFVSAEPKSPAVVPSSSLINKFLLKEDVCKAEILFCLEAVATHRSLRSAEKDTKLFAQMFKDSEIARGIQLGRDKMMYFLVFGIAPFFKESLIKEVLMCEHIVIGFDESLNKISQKQQMDINVRFWCPNSNEVKTRYLNSAFLGRSRSSDLLKAFQDATKPLILKKLLQVTMDGPNVNTKFFKDLSVSLKETPEDPEVLSIGSCGLHSVNLAFKTGAKCTNWHIFDFMRALYYLFKDSPARRALYTVLTTSNEFPKKFCSVRWLENSQVAERCLSIVPNVKVFVEKVEKDKCMPTSQSYITVKSLLSDPLLSAKLAFFNSVAHEFESFLREYQTDAPLVPFLYGDLSSLIRRILNRFIVKEALNGKHVMNVEFEEVKNFLPCKKIDVGISALCHIKKSKASAGQITTFQKDCRKFLISCVKKLKERSPLNYALTRAVSCFNPMVCINETLFNKRLTKLLLILCEKNWLNSVTADRAKCQFLEICSTASNVTKLKMYSKTEKLDTFWYNLLSDQTTDCNDAIALMKIVLILSQGNSNVERGFSINKDCLWDNMKDETLIARRIIYDSIIIQGGLQNFEISKQMLLSVRNSRSKFEEAKEKRRKEEKNLNENMKRKREAEHQLKELNAKKSKILEAAETEALRVEEEIASIKLLQKKL